MKRIIVYSLILLFLTSTAYSRVKVGVKGGLSATNISIKQNSSDRYQITYSSGLGFHFGLTSELEIFNLYLQPEMIFSTSNHDVTVDDILDNGVSEVGKQHFNRLDFPILAGVKFDNNFKVGLGPVFSKMISSKSDIFSDEGSHAATVGYQFAAGWDWDRFSIEGRYEGNLSKYEAGVRIGNNVYDFDQRSNQLILTLGLYF